MSEFTRVAVASRAFSLAAIIGLAFAFGNADALNASVLVIGAATVACYVTYVSPAPGHWVIAGEAAFASLIVVTALPDSVVLLPYLVVLSLLTGLARGIRGASMAVLPQLAAILAAMATSGSLRVVEHRGELLAPWAVTIVGAGLLGASAKKIGRAPAVTRVDENYDSARRLLGQLRNLALRLPSGLDPVTIATQILLSCESVTGPGQSAVFTRTKGGLFAPLAYRGVGAKELISPEDALIASVWTSGSAASRMVGGTDSPHTSLTVLPLRLGSEMVGIVVSRVMGEAHTSSLDVIQRELDELSVRLATALAFDEVRNLVTADERQRLAREIHDGVAQEVASLGYVVDELAARSNDMDVITGLEQLRRDLSRVVGELRLSIFDLRTEVADAEGLGSALSDYVHKIRAQSGMTVHLSIDEAHGRLNPSVEAELFRIAQEAITNARKHSRAQNLWVDCWVRPPSAYVRIRDDGQGLAAGREDSYGLHIMLERAERIGAHLTIEASDPACGRKGTSVTVSLSTDASSPMEGIVAAS